MRVPINHEPDETRSRDCGNAETKPADLGGAAPNQPALPEHAEEKLSAKEIDELRKRAAERDALWDRLLRTQADFENWRKRIERESRAGVRFAVQEFVQDILPVLDNLHRAIDAAEASHQQGPLLEGVRLVQEQFYDVLRANDVEPIHCVGEKFDPEVHEAVSVLRTADRLPFTVLEEVRKGFRIHERVIRPAQVVVSASPGENGGRTDAAGEGAAEGVSEND